MRPFTGRRVALVVSGGIAAYKSCYLARRLFEAGSVVDVILTESAERFVGPTTFESITGRPVHTSVWEKPMLHLELGLRADAIVAAPATANLVSSLAAGAAHDLATTAILAADCPVIVCPAMNTRMWYHPATQENVARLKEFGHLIVPPADGPLAEGESGVGRLPEPEEIMSFIGRVLESSDGMAGRKVVVTAGPTRAPLDPVRFISNPSSGRMGFALAESAWRRGAEVILIHGPGTIPPPPGPRAVAVVTSHNMLEAVRGELPGADALLMAAAVGDFVLPDPGQSKIKKGQGLELTLAEGPDLLTETRVMREENDVFTLGFALETDHLVQRGREKLRRKGMQLIAVNSPLEDGAGFGVETNRITLLDASGREEALPFGTKAALADTMMDRIEAALSIEQP